MKQFQRWNHQTRQYDDSVVYHVETGEAVPCYPVDGREMVATGAYSYERPTANPAVDGVAADEEAADAPEQVAPAAAPEPPRPTRRTRGK